ncbi:octanoyltransferase [Holospora elegans E1]|nr:hypothetical protein [Holospora elegans]GAJ45832.1 octanoyltransferase [Holospora elegans E1]
MCTIPFHCYRWSLPQDYPYICDAMVAYADDIALGRACESLWLLSHTPVYTLGAGALSYVSQDLNVPVYRAGRGGLLTFHGPEQRMIYPFIYIKSRGFTVSSYLSSLEQWVVHFLNLLGIQGECTQDRRGVWIQNKK